MCGVFCILYCDRIYHFVFIDRFLQSISICSIWPLLEFGIWLQQKRLCCVRKWNGFYSIAKSKCFAFNLMCFCYSSCCCWCWWSSHKTYDQQQNIAHTHTHTYNLQNSLIFDLSDTSTAFAFRMIQVVCLKLKSQMEFLCRESNALHNNHN